MPSFLVSNMPSANASSFKQKVLLIVDKNELVRKTILSNFRHKFDQIFATEDFMQAEIVLENNAVTHVICGQILNENDLSGNDIIPQWRWLYPSIRRAVILTGTNLDDFQLSDGVDSVLPKPSSLTSIFDTLVDEREETQAESTPDTSREILLIVDDNPVVLKSLYSALRHEFSEVFTADNLSKAESVLQDKRVTHLICDQKLGESEPLGVDLIRNWRHQYPLICRGLLLTVGDLVDIEISPESQVDYVFIKPVSSRKLLNELKPQIRR
ncbi:MAG: response regulator [Proteobacteria bacterium]|nr:response regulator [Pseudomonadota bacterium]